MQKLFILFSILLFVITGTGVASAQDSVNSIQISHVPPIKHLPKDGKNGADGEGTSGGLGGKGGKAGNGPRGAHGGAGGNGGKGGFTFQPPLKKT